MTKVYKLPNDYRIITDIDETTRTCTISETQLDSLISKLNYYAEGQDEVINKIRNGITMLLVFNRQNVLKIIDERNKERVTNNERMWEGRLHL